MELAFLLYNAFCGDFEHSKLHACFIYKVCEARKYAVYY
jgi:hypothetical protein